MGAWPALHGQAVCWPFSRCWSQARKSDVDVLICDTSGRLHTNFELMEELGACKVALSKRMKDAPHEVLLVLDGTTGMPPQPVQP